jgi:hypothetical protein
MRDLNAKVKMEKEDFVINSYSLEIWDEKGKRFMVLF